MTLSFAAFFSSVNRKKRRKKEKLKNKKRAMGNTIVLFLSFSFWGDFFSFVQREKGAEKKVIPP